MLKISSFKAEVLKTEIFERQPRQHYPFPFFSDLVNHQQERISGGNLLSLKELLEFAGGWRRQGWMTYYE